MASPGPLEGREPQLLLAHARHSAQFETQCIFIRVVLYTKTATSQPCPLAALTGLKHRVWRSSGASVLNAA